MSLAEAPNRSARASDVAGGVDRQRWVLPMLLGFTVLTLLYTHPLVLRLTWISPGSDYFQFMWNFWWVRTALESLQSPFFTTYQYHPTGTSLAFHTTSYHWAFLSVPFQYLLPRQSILNGFYILSFIATGMSTAYMLRYLRTGRGVAFVGACVFAFCTHRVDRFRFFEIDSLATMYMPLFVVGLLRMFESPAPGTRAREIAWRLGTGGFLALTALSSWYNGLFLAIFGVFIVGFKVLETRRLPIGGLTVAAFAFALLVGPFIGAMVAARIDGQFPSRSFDSAIRSSENNNADLLAYLVPNANTPSIGFAALEKLGIGAPRRWAREVAAQYFGNRAEKGVFPGYTVTLIALVSVGLACATGDSRLRRRLLFLQLSALLFVVLSFGPTLFVLGERVMALFPYRALMHVPFLNVARVPSRFGIMVMLCLAILVALTMNRLLGRISRPHHRWVVLAGTLMLLTVETLPVEPHRLTRLENRVPEYVRSLAQTPPQSQVILNLPVDFFGARGGGGLFLLHQTFHRQKIVGGYLGREPVYVRRQLRSSPVLSALHHRDYERDAHVTIDGISDAQLAATLDELAVDVVMLHRRLFRSEDLPPFRARFRKLLGEPTYTDSMVEVFAVEAGRLAVAPSGGP